MVGLLAMVFAFTFGHGPPSMLDRLDPVGLMQLLLARAVSRPAVHVGRDGRSAMRSAVTQAPLGSALRVVYLPCMIPGRAE